MGDESPQTETNLNISQSSESPAGNEIINFTTKVLTDNPQNSTNQIHDDKQELNDEKLNSENEPNSEQKNIQSNQFEEDLNEKEEKMKDEEKMKAEEKMKDEEEIEQKEEQPMTIKEAVKLLLKEQEIDIQLYPDAINEMQRMRDKALEKPDYEKADKIESSMKRAQETYQQLCAQMVQCKNSDRLQEKLNKAQNSLYNLQNKFNKAKEDFDIVSNSDREKLINRQQDEMNKLLEYYTSEIPPKYRKYSNYLLELRRKEKVYKNVHQYQDAKHCKEEADAIEAYENEVNKINWFHQRDKAIYELQKKHEKQMQCLIEKQNRHWEEALTELKKNEENWQIVVDNASSQLQKANSRMIQTRSCSTRSSYSNPYETKMNNNMHHSSYRNSISGSSKVHQKQASIIKPKANTRRKVDQK